MRLSNKAVTMLTTIILIFGVGATVFAVATLAPPPCTTGTLRTFSLVSTLNGFNDSAAHPSQQWPVLTVSRCDTVKIHLVNEDSSQAHGLAVALYENGGVTAGPGQTVTINFQANRTGQFKVYCSILCSIHSAMLNGVLNVE